MPAKKRRADFSNVSDGGAFSSKHRPEGDYIMKIVKAEDGESKAGNEQTVFTLIVADDSKKARPATYPYYAGWEPNQLWKIRKLFTAAGVAVPKKAVVVDPNKLVGKLIGAALEDDEYEGRMRSKIADVFPKDEVQDTPTENDSDEDEAYDDDEEVEEVAPKRPAKKTARRAPEPEEEDDDEDLEDDEEEEEPEPPRRRAAAKKAPARKAAAKKPPADEDDDDLDELDLEDI